MYRDRDFAFGQAMLQLRNRLNQTQAALAEILGISRRAVGDWEAGNSYPKIAHLQQLILLAARRHALPAGREAEEIRTFWQASRQKAPLDEGWLEQILAFSHESPVSPSVGMVPITAPILEVPPVQLRMDWGEALAGPAFYGREWELSVLAEWIIRDTCRMVSVVGLGGIGKSALAAQLMRQVSGEFQIVIWRSFRDILDSEALLDDLLRVLMPQVLAQLSLGLEQREKTLLEHMRGVRILLVLDNFESALEVGENSGRLLPAFEELGQFLRKCAETQHQSCVLITSREKPDFLVALEGSQSPVRAFRLARLDVASCEKLLGEKGIAGSPAEKAQLIEAYAGNPLALKIVTPTILDLFAGQLTPFLEQGETVFGGVRELFDRQYARLSTFEREVLIWLAIMREPITLPELRNLLVSPQPQGKMIEALDRLHRRSLIERGQPPGSFTLQSVILEYATALLIDAASREIQISQLDHLIRFGLVPAQAKDYSRQTQERMLAAPLYIQLQGQIDIEKQINGLLQELRSWPIESQGYGPANLLTLLRLHKGNLQELDLSHLAFRGMDLQNIQMQDTDLTAARLQNCIFSENLDAIWAVAISSSGQYWAAGTGRGEVRVWQAAGQELRLLWQGHAERIRALNFSPDEQTLASGTLDGMLQVWEVSSGKQLWSGWHANNVNSLTYSPDGDMLASAGNDANIHLWSAANGALLESLPHPAPVFAVAWSQDRRLIASGDSEGNIHLWSEPSRLPAGEVKTLRGHQKAVRGLAFSPDSRSLASGSYDGTLKLWNIDEDEPPQTLKGHTDWVQTVVWSPDGQTLASSGLDPSIWLWSIPNHQVQAVLQGHSAPVYGLAFTSDSHHLLSGGDDGTLRVWDTGRSQSVRTIQGYTPALYDLDWSPDGGQIASAGANGQVTLWDVTSRQPAQELSGHRWVVYGVGWSPDGKWVASSGWDRTLRLWDPAARKLADSATTLVSETSEVFFYGLAWSPNGQQVSSGTYLQGIAIWDISRQNVQWVGREFSTRFQCIAWRPDGTQIIAGGDDGLLYLWDPETGKLIQKLIGHQGAVKCAAWHSQRPWVATGSSSKSGGELFVWNTTQSDLIFRMEDPPTAINTVAWGQEPDVLVSGSGDGALRWWDVQSGKCLHVREAHEGAVLSLRRSPEGSRFASCGDDGVIMIWDAANGTLQQTFRRDRPYERLNITGILGLTETQKQTLFALGAFEEKLNNP
jgi:WD40 repeat protein/transcriptional regulator with XRE-family HTH domain